MRLKQEDKTNIVSAMIAELSFRDKAATARELYRAAFPKQEDPTAKSMAGISKILAKECKHIILPNSWTIQLFYVKDSQIENKDFKDIEELYFLHNMEQIARQRLLAKKNRKDYKLEKPLIDFLKKLPPWEINSLKEYQAKRIELTKQCLTKNPTFKASKNKSSIKTVPSSDVVGILSGE